MQVTTFAVALFAAASGASAFTKACPHPRVLCGFTLNNEEYGKSACFLSCPTGSLPPAAI